MLRAVRSPAMLVAEARSQAGLSRRALAERAGVPTSTVSRIEDGEMDPTYTMLARVLGAAGRQLRTTAAELPDTPSLARLADAWQPTSRGTTFDWTRLRGFVDWLDQHPERVEEAIATPPARSDTALDGLLAGMAEKLADDKGVDRPRWTAAVPPLREAWIPPGTARMVARAEQATPPQLKQRNIVLAERDLWRAGTRAPA
jgi:transcriptional regulator with XRE-family HTH domain